MIPVRGLVGGLIAGVCVLLISPRATPAIWDVVSRKDGGDSAAVRSYSNSIALDVLRESAFLGTGLGSNRASSLLLMLLSTIGVLGTILFLLLLGFAARRAMSSADIRSAGLALLVFCIAAFVSLADFASPLLWSLLSVCLCAGGPVALSDRRSAPVATLGRWRGKDAEDHRVSPDHEISQV